MRVVDFAIVAAYLLGIVAVGFACRGRQDNIRDYFTGSGGFSGVLGQTLVGLSIAATFFSGLSFVAYPSIVYTHGITVLSSLAFFPVAYALLRWWFLPRYLAEPAASPYEIVERRFGRPVRLAMAAMFVLLRLSWMAALIYAPVLVVMAGASLDREWFWPLVLGIGLSSTAYTVAGGIRGVIVTDALQFVLIAGSLVATIVYVLWRMPVGAAEVAALLRADSGLLTPNWSLDPTVMMTVWAMALGGGVQNLSSFMADPMSLQRYLAAGDTRSATRAFATSAVAMPVVLVLLAGVGLVLGAWYHLHPDSSLPTNADRVFPHFVATQMPAGFMGLVVAAILAATMSSITSGINALAGSLLVDFRRPGETLPDARLLRRARVASGAIGVLATLAAGYVERLGTLFDVTNILFGVFLGPLLGVMICAVTRWRLRTGPLIAGIAFGWLAGLAVAYSPVANLWVTLASCAATLIGTGLATTLAGRRA